LSRQQYHVAPVNDNNNCNTSVLVVCISLCCYCIVGVFKIDVLTVAPIQTLLCIFTYSDLRGDTFPHISTTNIFITLKGQSQM